MKRWAVLVVALYAAMLALLTLPVVFVCTIEYSGAPKSVRSALQMEEMLALFTHWGWWLWLAVMAAGQALLLLVPVSMAQRRPERRRPVMVPTIVASFFLANLAVVGLTALVCVTFSEDSAWNILSWPIDASIKAVTLAPVGAGAVAATTPVLNSTWGAVVIGLGYVAIFWMLWGLIFFRYSREDTSESITARAVRWLLRGSILELLVAVPSHIIVRHRGDCCAPAATFWGITMGLSVMLMAFGPGVFFLFVERMRRLQPTRPGVDPEP